jgi:serine/threonine protein kinase
MASAALARAGSGRAPSFRVDPLEDGAEDDAAPVEGIELGPLLGRGSYGRVYLGRWNGQEVAIKASGPI